MSKYANAGELRTPVRFLRPSEEVNDNGFPVAVEPDVMNGPVMCKWVNAHGSEALTAYQMRLREPATLTTRYSPQLDDATLIVERGEKQYEVISVDNVEQRNIWLEIKVQRKEAAQ